mmetsp:Transcript_10086/g.30823  ORF Transcript_10086/g.30823 Transcript_10086/m.30823 type:complete len:240 (-) Transcript_10086:896-1615(-)
MTDIARRICFCCAISLPIQWITSGGYDCNFLVVFTCRFLLRSVASILPIALLTSRESTCTVLLNDKFFRLSSHSSLGLLLLLARRFEHTGSDSIVIVVAPLSVSRTFISSFRIILIGSKILINSWILRNILFVTVFRLFNSLKAFLSNRIWIRVTSHTHFRDLLDEFILRLHNLKVLIVDHEILLESFHLFSVLLGLFVICPLRFRSEPLLACCAIVLLCCLLFLQIVSVELFYSFVQV